MKIKVCEIINAITILKTQNNDVNLECVIHYTWTIGRYLPILKLKESSDTLFPILQLMYLVNAHTDRRDLCPTLMIR